MENSKVDFYYNAYNQKGGEFPVFKGSRYMQYGSGFGDILRGIFRRILPVVSKGAVTFLGDLLQNHSQTGSWSDAAKSSIVPAAKAALNQAAEEISQTGSGKKKRKRKQKSKKATAHKTRLYKGSNPKAKKPKIASHFTKFNF